MCIGANRWIFSEKNPYCSELGRKMSFFAIQNLVDIQSSRFRWYSFVFERTQSHLVLFLVNSCGQKANYKWRSYQADRPLVSYLGGPGGPLRRTQMNENFRAVRPHHRADMRTTRKKITTSFSYMGHNIKKCAFLAIRVPWVAHKNLDRAHLAPQLSSHIYQSTYKIWKQSDKDFLSYRENNEMSANADADTAA